MDFVPNVELTARNRVCDERGGAASSYASSSASGASSFRSAGRELAGPELAGSELAGSELGRWVRARDEEVRDIG